MKRLDTLVARRGQVAALYESLLGDIAELTLPAAQPWARVNWFVYVVRVATSVDRDGLIRFLDSRGIASRAYFPVLHLQPYFQKLGLYQQGMFPVAEDAGRRAVALPFFNSLQRDDIAAIAQTIKEGIKTGAVA